MSPISPNPITTLELMTYNVRLGIETSLEALAAAIRAEGAPDVLALQEIGVRWRMGEPIDQPAYLARALGLPFHTFAGALTDAEGGRFGIAVLSRFPLAAADVSLLPMETDEQRVALRVTLHTSPAVHLVNTHLSVNGPERLRQAERVSRLLAECDGPRLLMGDMNDVPDSPVVSTLRAGLTDLFDATGMGDPLTFSVKSPNRRIDYLMAGGGLMPSGPTRVSRGVRTSDHFPLRGKVAWGAPPPVA